MEYLDSKEITSVFLLSYSKVKIRLEFIIPLVSMKKKIVGFCYGTEKSFCVPYWKVRPNQMWSHDHISLISLYLHNRLDFFVLSCRLFVF